MKTQHLLALQGATAAMLFTTAIAVAAEIDWYSMDGGGGVSTANNITLVGVIGQTDTIRMTGGSISLSGGYLPIPPQSNELFKDGFE